MHLHGTPVSYCLPRRERFAKPFGKHNGHFWIGAATVPARKLLGKRVPPRNKALADHSRRWLQLESLAHALPAVQ